MGTFDKSNLSELLAERPGPHVSLYAPMHAGACRVDPIRWRNLLGLAERQLATSGQGDPAGLLAPAARLLDDPAVWNAGAGGLACFLAPGFDRWYRLGLEWPARAVVGGQFLVKPLLPWLDGGAFYVLALSRNAVRLLRVTPHGWQRVEIPGPPLDLGTALATHDTDEPLTLHTVGRGPGRWDAVFHGHGVGIDDAKDDLLRYFRVVAKAVHPALQGERTPLVLAGVEYLWPIFRNACDYPYLLDDGVKGNPDRLGDGELAGLARTVVEPLFRHRREKALGVYRGLVGTGRTAREVEAIVPAATRGRVETVLVSTDRDVWGRYDSNTGRVEVHETEQPGDDELTNLAAVGALRHGRAVHVVRPDELPDGAEMTAVFPLPLPKHHRRG